VEPVRSYVICCVQRTGSWLLAHTLADTGYAGRPSDYFDDAERKRHTREWGLPAGDLTPYVRAMRDHATTPNGVLGCKLMWNDYDSLRSGLHPPAGTDAGLQFMQMTFPNPQFVWLRRADKVRCEDGWRQWFTSTGIQPYEVLYEGLATNRLAVANGVLEFLRLPRLDADHLPPVRYRKQADSLTETCVDLVRSAMRPRCRAFP
jgi:LPS sulfotransferase NodH